MSLIYKLPYWVTKTVRNEELFLFNWKNNKSVIIYDKTHPVYELKGNADISVNSDISKDYEKDIQWLLEADFLVQNVVDDVFAESFRGSFNEKDLHLILLPAGEACNLNCVYCYEDHSYKKRMDSSSADRLISFIKKINPQAVHIEYFGGEPMLNMKFIQEFSEKLIKNNIAYKAAITTNGTLLTPGNLEKLYNSGIKSFQITIDGARHLHNKLRVSNSKNINSYDSVSNALRSIQLSPYQDVNCVVRINSNEETVEDGNLTSFYNDFSKIIPPGDGRFFIFPKPIGDYLSANLKSSLQAQSTYCEKSSVTKVTSRLENLFSSNGYLLADPIMLTKNHGYACYAGNKNSFVINPDFKIFKCTVALDDPINDVGVILENGDFLSNENFSLWIKDYSDKFCNTCFAQKTCGGNACPLINLKFNEKKCPPLRGEADELTFKAVKFYERISDV